MTRFNRRKFIAGSSLASVGLFATSPLTAAVKADPAVDKYQNAAAAREIARLEKRIGGRLGVALTDRTGAVALAHRGEERFAMCSTFKLPLAFCLFDAAEKGEADLKAPIMLREADLVPYAPYVEAQLAARQSVTLQKLAKAAVMTSDNAAANIVLKAVGGPAGFTRFVRSQNDTVTRLDRIEPLLNENKLGDPRDTSSPIAFAQLMHRLMIPPLKVPNSLTVYDWMAQSKTGLGRIRLGIPYGWPVGNKTGTAPGGLAYNDAAIFWPSFAGYGGDEPRFLTVFTDRPTAERALVERSIAEVGKIAAWVAQRRH